MVGIYADGKTSILQVVIPVNKQIRLCIIKYLFFAMTWENICYSIVYFLLKSQTGLKA
jgi:hypothetical protein